MTTYAIKNRQSGMVIDHYAGQRIEAFDASYFNTHRTWRIIQIDSDHILFKNVATGFLLGHYPGEPLRARGTDESNIHCHWRKLIVHGDGYVALCNRATGNVLDHYREQTVQAYDKSAARPSQHWQLVPVPEGRRGFQFKTELEQCDLDQYGVVAFRNVGTGGVLDHYAGERIEAFTNSGMIPKHMWFRIPVGDGCYAYKNLYTGKVLEHYYGQSVQAFTTITHLPSHQWTEVALADGRIAIRNCASGDYLHHCHELSIQACKDNVVDDLTMQWTMQVIRRAKTDTTALKLE